MVKQEDSELLSAYLDGQVSPDQGRDIQKRLAASPEWRSEMKKLESSKLLLGALSSMPMPEDLLAVLENEARQRIPLVKPARPSLSEQLRLFFNTGHRWVLAGSVACAVLTLTVIQGIQTWQQPKTIPLTPLLVAHARAQHGSGFAEYVLSASSYSKQIKLVRNKNA